MQKKYYVMYGGIMILLTLWVVSCTYRKVDIPTPIDPTIAENQIKNIIVNNCSPCHIPDFGGTATPDLSTISLIKKGLGGKDLATLPYTDMGTAIPPSADLTALQNWLGGSSSIGTPITSFTANILPMFKTGCSCHIGGGATDFSTIDAIKKAGLTDLANPSTAYSAMPVTPPSAFQIALFTQWVAEGYPE